MIRKKGNILWFTALLLTILIVAFTGKIQVNAEMTTMEKKLYTLEYPSWMEAQGLSKGIYHDRQDLGVVLPKGATIEIRQKNPNFTGDLQIQLLNNDRQTETTTKFNKSWVTVTANYESVPFISTTFTEEAPVVEYRVSETALSLPVFNEGDTEANFFDKWDKNNSGYGLIRNKYIQILVPAKDKSYLKNMDDFSSINDLSVYYTKLFETYNEMEGLSFTPERATDKNVPNRFFAKADIHGVGSGFFGVTYTGETSDSVTAFWLKPSWGGLHEIGHGYHGNFMNDSTFSTHEVWNNLLALGFQEKYRSDYFDKTILSDRDSTLLKELEFEDDVYNDKIPAGKWDIGKKLYLLTLMKEKAGNKAFAHFNQSYRAAVNAGTLPEDNLLFDYLSKYFGESSRYDFTPFMELVQGTLSENQKMENLYAGNKAVYPLASLLSGNNLRQARKDILLSSKWGLVSNQELAKYKLTNTSEIQFTINDFNQIKGKTLRIKDGADVIRNIKITAPTMTIKNIPVGIYSLDIPTGMTRFYKPSTNYLAVSDGQSKTTIQMNELQTSTVASEQLIFRGVSNAIFAKGIVDPEAGKFTLNVTKGDPHWLFSGRYAAVEIFDEEGESVFSHVMNGVKTETGRFEANIKPGYTIKVIHEEPSRISILNASPGLVNNAITNTLQVTKYGLTSEQKKVTAQDALANYKEKLEKLATSIRQNSAITSEDYSVPKTQLKKAIAYLADTDTDKIKYQQDYAELLALKNDISQDLLDGSQFRFQMKGFANREFANVLLDLDAKQATITQNAGVPHESYPSMYASIKINNAKGKVLFQQNYAPQTAIPASEDKVKIAVGDFITVMHREYAGRLAIINTTTNEHYTTYPEATYLVTEDGLKKVDAKQIPTPNADEFDGSHFQFEFQGLSNVRFALMTLDLTNKQAKIQQNTRQPHSYFPGTYASIDIHDARGKLVYKKAYGGQEKLVADMFNVKIDTGYYVTVTHLEAGDRLKFTNTDTKELFPYCQAATYKITEEGLVKVATGDIPTFSSDYIDGNIFKYAFSGFENRNFADLTIDLTAKKLEVSTNPGIPHRDYDKTAPYASIQVKDKDGSEVYRLDIIGDEELGSVLKKISIEEGDYLIITHLEASNSLSLTVDDVTQGVMSQQNAYEVTPNGLTKKNLDEIPVPNRFTKQKLYTSNVDFTFKGFSNRKFAVLHLDKEKNMLHLEGLAIQPHRDFSGAYASIEVRDIDGKIVFSKNFIGNVIQNVESLDIPIQDGYTIQINHREPSTVRLEVKDNENNKIHQMSVQNEFLVVARGLVRQ
ncbi:putative mucin/carbohydrate-binding domain-containing protein [Listeria booriae]|uniref:putative mucin/carbohydrate-binding domain-containing protein n=1 Tax=Listeria booriae TaxID=1552123 RepID=UPI0016242C87|nr:putative mucin/carbohydrate-binding domain-containing protein [Listeria booriae]MBC1512579.1 enhancing factor (viral) [Listeria booriae]MBC6151695.1 enhancing factor (viral) [Listeria booriae]